MANIKAIRRKLTRWRSPQILGQKVDNIIFNINGTIMDGERIDQYFTK